ncbi:MAG: hypothetical protein ABR978_06660 [Dehalococcoidia bacterium]|jgi:hypothetical protein
MRRIAVRDIALGLSVVFLAAFASGCGDSKGSTPSPAAGHTPATTAPVATAVSGIAIDIASGETTTTIYPGDTAALAVDNGRIDVTVRFLRPLTDAERQAIRVSVNSPKWEVEAKTTPAEDAYAFVLRGATPTALIVQMSGMPGPTTVRFTIRVSSPSARLATSNI